MNVHAIADEALGNSAYFIELADGSAIVVDPRRDAWEHLDLAKRRGLRIVAVLETHLHADFVSGARELAEATGAEIIAAADSHLASAYRPVKDGSRVDFGGVTVGVLGTAGHTPEHIAFLVTAQGARAVFSGGSLLVGGAARTDLSGNDRTAELARAQYASLRRIAALPDDTLLYPTHGGGSFCTTAPAGSASSTIGAERAANPLFTIRDEETFVRELVAGFGSYPRYFAHLRDVNRSGPVLVGALPPVRQIEAHEASAAAARGSWLIDGRPASDWSREHAEGSVSNAVRPSFASWLGWVVPFREPIVLIVDPDQVEEAVRQCRLIGYDNIDGWMTFESWRTEGLATSSSDLLSAEQAADRAEHGAVLLDVRQRSEFAEAHVAGATHLELGDIIAGKSVDVGEIVTYCGHGERAATAASLLMRSGRRVATFPGGTDAWRRAGFSVGS
jgi:hydroxyacylglutathione hydrolase